MDLTSLSTNYVNNGVGMSNRHELSGVEGLEVSQVAGLLGCSGSNVTKMILDGELEARKKYVGDFKGNPYIITTPPNEIIKIPYNGKHAILKGRLSGTTVLKKRAKRTRKDGRRKPLTLEQKANLRREQQRIWKQKKSMRAKLLYQKESGESLASRLGKLPEWLVLPMEKRELLLQIGGRFTEEDLQVILSL